MLKTNKEIEKEFDEIFSGLENLTNIIDTQKVKSFIHQTRIADLEEMERMVKEMKESMAMGLVYMTDGFPPEKQYEVAEAHAGVIIKDILSHIQKLKEEIEK